MSKMASTFPSTLHRCCQFPLHKVLAILTLFTSLFLSPLVSQSAYAEETPTKRLTYEEYVKFAEQAIRSLSAQVRQLQAENGTCQGQLSGLQTAATKPATDQAQELNKSLVSLEKDLLKAHDADANKCNVTIIGELSCQPDSK